MIDMVNDKVAGAHSEIVLKIYADQFEEARRIAEDVVRVVEKIPGAADVAVDQEPPLPQLQITINREAAARFGINVSDISDLIEIAIGGKAVSEVFMGERKYAVAIRYIESARNSPEAIGSLTLTAPSGAKIPLSQVADIRLGSGESTITREMNRHHLTVKIDLRGRDLSSFLVDARSAIARSVTYDPARYEFVWGGQFENQQRAQSRLTLIIPLVVAIIFLLLYAAFGTPRHAVMVLACLPLAVLGGVIFLHLRGITLNMSSVVGFIALSGVAVQNGVIMLANLNRWRTLAPTLGQAVVRGAVERLRPVLLTALVGTFGLVPAAFAHGVGSDVQRPLATVIVGGLISATLLTLVVLPALYYVLERRREEASAK
jgi:cobalt-zinc-cadmium resistance protein CzcA